MNATAQALVAEATPPEAVTETPAESPEVSEASALEEIWDKANTEEKPAETASEPNSEAAEEKEPEAEEAAPEEPESEPEKAVEVPTDLPKAIKEAWGDIPEAAQQAFVDSQRRMSRQLADQGRLVQAISPIKDALVTASSELPALANMRPEQVAQEIMDLAKISQDFNSKPVETMAMLMKQHNLEGAMRQYLGGERPNEAALQNNQLRNEITKLQRQLQQVSDPEYLRSQMQTFTSETQAVSEVEKFAQTADHWSEVEAQMPAAIAFVKNARPDASPQDVLQSAYDLAVSQTLPEVTKAKQEEAAEHAAIPVDPARTEAAKKAKSVNVRSTTAPKPKALSEAEELSRVYDRMQE